MASPQTEDGYTRIANELLEALSRLDASGSAWRVFMVIVRKTYGYQKKSDCVSLSQFVALSGLTHRSVCRGVDELVRRNVILVENSGYTNKYSVQKNYELWGSVKPVTSDKNDTGSSVKPVTETSDKNDTYKRKKERKKICEQSSQQVNNQKKHMAWQAKHSDDDSDLPVVGEDGSIKREQPKVKRTYPEVYKLFDEVLERCPANWTVNTTQQKCAENLYTERGLKAIKTALLFYKENKDKEFCPQINSPSDLDAKWTKLATFKTKHGN